MQNDLEKAIAIIKNGGIVVIPTDTVFGIACRIDDEDALKRLFRIKKRSESQSVPVLVDSVEMTQEYVVPISQEIQEKLIQKYWPGGLTIVFPCLTDKVSPLVRGNGETIALRIPNHPIVQQLIHAVGKPIVGTSANFHGHATPVTKVDLDPEFVALVDFVLPGECYNGMSSTIIDCSVKPWKILREGAVKLDL